MGRGELACAPRRGEALQLPTHLRGATGLLYFYWRMPRIGPEKFTAAC